ncbi:MAG TPA: hypothetical protein VF263_02755, partial [Longimicrobiaceae bacterium]
AVDPRGRVLYLPFDTEVSVAELVAKSTASSGGSSSGSKASASDAVPGFAACEADTAPPVTTTPAFGADLYLILASHAEALCGQEEVLGKLCEEACVTGTNRPSRREGVVLRAVPIDPGSALCTAAWLTRKHRRSQAASAYFAMERATLGHDISGSRLKTAVWCFGATAETGDAVPLGVMSLNGGALEWVDGWIARREKMETSPRRYWAWQMMMRPWAVYMAQLLQFQCQLNDQLAGTPDGGEEDPCSRQRDLLRETQSLLEEMEKRLAAAGNATDSYRPEYLTRITDLRGEVAAALTEQQVSTETRVLISGGIVELPPAGYLPVVPGGVSVNTQVRRLLGEGVDLRFCVVRPDYVAHALEEAQHLERICLLGGLDDPEKRQEVDVLVPDGELLETEKQVAGHLFEAKIRLGGEGLQFGDSNQVKGRDTLSSSDGGTDGSEDEEDATGLVFRGAARAEVLPTGGGAFYFAGIGGTTTTPSDPAQTVGGNPAGPPPAPVYQPAAPVAETQLSAPQLRSAKTRSKKSSRAQEEAAAAAPPPPQEPGLEIPRIPTVGDVLRRLFRGSAGAGGTERYARATTTETTTPPSTNDGSTRIDLPSVESGAAPSLWAALRCERNPLALAVGETTAFRADLAVGVQKDQERVGGEVALRGDLWCDQGGDGSTTLKGRAKGWVTLSATNDDEPNAPKQFSASVQLDLATLAGGGTSLTLTFRLSQGFEFTITTSWKGTPILAESVATLDALELISTVLLKQAGSDPQKIAQANQLIAQYEQKNPQLRSVEFARADLRESAEVARVESPYHQQAVQALATIEKALDEPGFREAGERLLFPPAQPRSAEQVVRATRDWVLFHRRRPTSCDCCGTPAVVAPPRRYRVYHVKATGPVTVAEIRKALRGTEDIPGLETVGVVPVFAADTATLTTPRTQVLEAWRELDRGGEIIYGAVAGAGSAAADPDAVQAARLDRVSSIADDLTPDHRAVYDVLDTVPLQLSDGGVDGVILLITRDPQPQTATYRVYGLRDQGMMNWIKQQIPQNTLGAELQQNTDLGTVTFQWGTSTPTGGTLPAVVQKWRDDTFLKDKNVARGLVVIPSEGVPPADAQSQGGAVATALLGTLTEGHAVSSEALFGQVQGIIILEPTQRVTPTTACHMLYRIDNYYRNDGYLTFDRFRDLINEGNFDAAFSLQHVTELGMVQYTAGTATLVTPEQDLRDWWSADGLEAVRQAATLFRTSDPEAGLQPQRSQRVIDLLNSPNAERYDFFIQQPLTGCPAATVLVTVDKYTVATDVKPQ